VHDLQAAPACTPRLDLTHRVTLIPTVRRTPGRSSGEYRKPRNFADGVTEDLTTDLSRISHMLVIRKDGRNFTKRKHGRETAGGALRRGRVLDALLDHFLEGVKEPVADLQ
jgi:ATP phosphoribosyltransferase regulatory subunit HisZ